MKLDIEKIEIKNVAPNINIITHDNIILKFFTCFLCLPFGLENEYGKYIIKLELDNNNAEHLQLKKIILHVEKLIMKKMNIEENEFKSIIKKRNGKNDMLELRIKTIKNKILTDIEYQDKENNYLKTLYDIKKQSQVKVQIEINGLWDYRTDKKENNKSGLIVYANKIIVNC
jgi:hypothetical protein